MMKTAFFFVLTIMMLTSGVAQVQVSITPPTVVQSTFNPITVSVRVSGVTGLRASSVTVQYDPTVLKLSGFQKGTFLESNPDGFSTSYFTGSVNDAAGSFTVDETIMGSSMATGGGVLFTLEFAPVAGGTTTLTLTSVRLRDVDNAQIGFSTAAGSVTIAIADVRIKAFLEAPPLSRGGMTASLINWLPQAQPYSVSPWGYSGAETVPAGFFTTHTDIVDWVLVELRTGTNAASIAGKRAGFMISTGEIVDVDGVSPLRFSVSPNSMYYIVVRHRNHLAVMSAQAVSIGSPSAVYDFSTSMGQAYGDSPMKLVATGVYALFTGDANADGQITGNDYNVFYAGFTAITSGYVQSDFSLDGAVNGTDYGFYYQNFYDIRSSRVPE